jgi:hypothetical protein
MLEKPPSENVPQRRKHEPGRSRRQPGWDDIRGVTGHVVVETAIARAVPRVAHRVAEQTGGTMVMLDGADCH